MKKILSTIAAAAMITGLAAEADAGSKKLVTGIIIGAGAAALLGAAANAAESSADDPSYAYDDQYNPRQNAIAACLHRSYRVLQGRGIEGTELDEVLGVRPAGSSSLKVDLSLTTYDQDGLEDGVDVTCRVFRDRVTRISIR